MMSTPATRHDVAEDIAARWLIRREDPEWSQADEDELARWIDESMTHRAAFWRLERGWREADRVAALGSERTGERKRRRWRRWTAVGRSVSRPVRAAGAAAVMAVVIGAALSWHTSPVAPVTVAYQTPIGGQRMLALADGSKVQMNTATRLRAAPGGMREVWLDNGEAFFDIAHRTDRNFVVHAGPRTITVLGTRFSVRRMGTKVTVVVTSGRVRIDDAQAISTSARTAIVSSGNVAVVEAQSTLITTAGQAHVAAMTAWRDGVIVFDDTPLRQAAAEFGRYSAAPIVIGDASLSDLRIGGTFRTTDRDAFISLLHDAYGIRVREQGATAVLER